MPLLSFLIHILISCILPSSTFISWFWNWHVSWFVNPKFVNFLIFPGRRGFLWNFLPWGFFQRNFLVAALPLLPFSCHPGVRKFLKANSGIIHVVIYNENVSKICFGGLYGNQIPKTQGVVNKWFLIWTTSTLFFPNDHKLFKSINEIWNAPIGD